MSFRGTRWMGFSAALLMVLALTPVPSSSQTAALEDFEGTWTSTRSARDLRSHEQGIDHVADLMNIFIREIARGEMRRRIPAETRLAFHFESETRVQLSVDEWGPNAFEIGGPTRRVRGPEGEDVHVRLSFVRGRIVHRQRNGGGHRTNTYSLNGDASRLTMSASISSDQLPDDVRYRLTFRRSR